MGPSTLDWPTGEIIPYALDSGVLSNVAAGSRAVFEGVVHVQDASWVRLYFGQVQLAPGSFVRVTSGLDNEVQELDAQGLARWGNTSAYFNGDTVSVQLIAAARSAGNRVSIISVARPIDHAPDGPQPVGGSGECGICGSDDRVGSGELWACRLLPAGCTASVFNEASCLVSAGHCIRGSMVVQFNVPDSNADCSLNNPPVADQFPITEVDSVNGGVGNDWSVLIPGVNNVGELPYDRYGELRPIATSVPSPVVSATVWGYGVDNTCTRSQTQQTHTGSIVGLSSTTIEWTIDIRGGNSGSSIIHEGEIVGIVTHCNSGGCPAFPNLGTRIDLSSFAAARDALCGESLTFSFPDGLPEVIAPEGGTSVRVVVSADVGMPAPGTGTVHISVDGGPFVETAMAENAPNDYEAVFPAVDCGAVVHFFFAAETESGLAISSPSLAPDQFYIALGAESVVMVFDDDFQSDLGWTVSGTALDGQWDRGVPIGLATCDRGNPGTDGDGSGQCYLTDNSSAGACNSDVDDGATVLTSPILDASDPDSAISYWRWYSNTAGSNPFQDDMNVEVSDDSGSSWTVLETIGPTGPEADGGWFFRTFRIDDFVTTTNQFRIRFTVSDTDPQSVVEAAVDGVLLSTIVCPDPSGCVWDLDGSGDVGIVDLLDLLAVWGSDPGGPPDFDGDGSVGITDFLELLANWGPCF